MGKERLAAFSDGVIAIIITIMVLELKTPHGTDPAALRPLVPVFLSYVLSFVYVGIYWNNHHHMLYMTERVNGGILWANMNLLFWLSLIPFVSGWMGENHAAAVPMAAYGVILLMCGLSYCILQASIIRSQGRDGALARALGRDIKGKISPVFYTLAIAVALVQPQLAGWLYALPALMWLIPDRRIERAVEQEPDAAPIPSP